MTTEMQEIVGKVITSIKTNGENLWIETPEGTYHYETRNDCCNKVWFSDIVNFQGAITVEKVLFQDWKAEEDEKLHWSEYSDGHEEYMKFIIIKQDEHRGDNIRPVVIDVRNNHNGYYGGEVVFIGVGK